MDPPKQRGRKSNWTAEQFNFLDSHREGYANANETDKTPFWRMLFPLWFAKFPSPGRDTPTPTWPLQDNNTDDSAVPKPARKGKKKTKGEMTPDEAIFLVSSFPPSVFTSDCNTNILSGRQELFLLSKGPGEQDQQQSLDLVREELGTYQIQTGSKGSLPLHDDARRIQAARRGGVQRNMGR